MITAEAAAEGSYLRIVCAGPWGSDSRGTRCGYLLRDTIRRGLSDATTAITEIVIDFTKVDYGLGDGPGWAVLEWATEGVKVTYLAGERGGRFLQQFFAIVDLDRFINFVIVNNARS